MIEHEKAVSKFVRAVFSIAVTAAVGIAAYYIIWYIARKS
jgi:hypothetical protein